MSVIKILRPTAVVVSVDDVSDTAPPPGDLHLKTDRHGSIRPGPTWQHLDQIQTATLALEFLLGFT